MTAPLRSQWKQAWKIPFGGERWTVPDYATRRLQLQRKQQEQRGGGRNRYMSNIKSQSSLMVFWALKFKRKNRNHDQRKGNNRKGKQSRKATQVVYRWNKSDSFHLIISSHFSLDINFFVGLCHCFPSSLYPPTPKLRYIYIYIHIHTTPLQKMPFLGDFQGFKIKLSPLTTI